MKLLLSLLILFFFFPIKNFCQDKQEIRAVWVTTNYRLDWPSIKNKSESQKNELIEIFENIKSYGLNTIYFQVRSNGTALFNSKYEPYPNYIKVNRYNNPEFDPAEYAVNLADNLGLKIHAWINVMRCFSGNDKNIFTHKRHIINRYPQWVVEYSDGENLSYWLDPGLPEVRSYLIKVIADLVTKYEFDGIHLDFLRYPGKNFNDDFSYNAYGSGENRDDWRRSNINKFLSELKKKIKLIKPELEIGATPVGIYNKSYGVYALQGYRDLYQDSRFWLENNFVDYIVPQIYWAIDNNPGFKTVADDWIKNSFGKDIILGIAAFKNDVKNDLRRIVKYSREIKAAGFSIFRYSDIKDIDLVNTIGE
jgi:uncharacterized lipoprotein YddW (UPF0748 family)